ncbi:GTPase ObgE [Synechococcus sp. PCC 7336]|uniref:GTPase ObgE n=1 Tax=Synechococcus sp. PCC 7336 TaxID=195250 RepID=UPI00034AE5E0|nr:GTPase ObgE [Synechococcus sp. PCC 7336]
MQFIDRATVAVKAGDGGDGMVAFRREKYVPAGGPSGGNGGKGGSAILVADANLQTLLDFQFKRLYAAEPGAKGGPSNKTGRSGNDALIRVPCGTIVFDADTEEFLGDLTEPGQQLCVAKGGANGLGNAHFLSNRNRAPEKMTLGKPGEERRLQLELKLIAEVGIIGLPNAGKSTLISALSSARPKVANYPFTTLVPNLGVVRRPSGDGVVFADIPGLIEGAHEGVGLGYEFLRHIERTRLLVHLVDGSEPDPVASYEAIQAELSAYDRGLPDKLQIVALNKVDAIAPEELADKQQALQAASGGEVLMLSAVTQLGCDRLLRQVFASLEHLKADSEIADPARQSSPNALIPTPGLPLSQ